MNNEWHDIKEVLPPIGEEVLVWIDGHRGPAWRNNHALVAFRGENGNFYEERHISDGPLIGIIKWQRIVIP